MGVRGWGGRGLTVQSQCGRWRLGDGTQEEVFAVLRLFQNPLTSFVKESLFRKPVFVFFGDQEKSWRKKIKNWTPPVTDDSLNQSHKPPEHSPVNCREMDE